MSITNNQFKVVTCLACGNRQLFEIGDYVGAQGKLKRHLERGCACGQNDAVVSSFEYYANAKKLLEIPLRKEFVLIHKALRSKLKVIDLLKEMIDTCSAEVSKAEIADDVKPLKSVAKWLMAVSVTGVTNEQTETPEGSGEDQEQPVDRAEGSKGDVGEGDG